MQKIGLQMLCLLCASLTTASAASAAPGAPGADAVFYPPAGLDMSAPDPSTRPGDDFFQFANGAWLARTAIPPDKPFMTEAQAVRDRIQIQLHDLVEGAAAANSSRSPSTLEGKVGAFYKSFMDERHVEELGVRPMAAELSAIRRSANRAALAELMGRSTSEFYGTFIQVSTDVDLKDTTHYAVYLSQAGLSMPDRDYYLLSNFAHEREDFRAYVEKLLNLAQWPSASVHAAAILALETRIASASWSKAEQRDLTKAYNPMTPAALAAYAPGLPWKSLMRGAGFSAKTRLVVSEKTAFPKIAEIFAATPVDTLKAWLAFTVLDSAAPALSHAFVAAHFDFHDRELLGLKEQPVRWKRGVAAVSGGDCSPGTADCFGTLGWAVGQLYTARYFPPQTKRSIESLVANIIAAYRLRIQKNAWMSEKTRNEALHKLDTYNIKVGYPDHPRDYSSVVIKDDDLIGNMRRAAAADWAFYRDRSDGAVDKTDWGMTPQTVDAYNGSLRDIVFPAAILQPPGFDPNADAAVNYGAIGSTIGHELTHGFDDQGRTLDASGQLRDWWTPQDASQFKARAAILGAQFATYEPVPGIHINPDLTMGENIADLGGVVIALEAYHLSLHGSAAPLVDGLTGDQRFFRAYAQDWRGKGTEDYIRQLTISNPHSYRKYRVNGIVRNVDAWYEAFDVKPTDKLYVDPAQRARIW